VKPTNKNINPLQS